MINPPEGYEQVDHPGNVSQGLWDALASVQLWGHAGGLWASDAARFAEIVATFDSLDYEKTRKIASVKAEALRRIAALFGIANADQPAGSQALMFKEMNATARGVELVSKGAARTAGEEADAAQLEALWGKVKAIRAASNQVEADINALAMWKDVEATDIAGSARWPR
jgi:hypothetical protein